MNDCPCNYGDRLRTALQALDAAAESFTVLGFPKHAAELRAEAEEIRAFHQLIVLEENTIVGRTIAEVYQSEYEDEVTLTFTDGSSAWFGCGSTVGDFVIDIIFRDRPRRLPADERRRQLPGDEWSDIIDNWGAPTEEQS